MKTDPTSTDPARRPTRQGRAFGLPALVALAALGSGACLSSEDDPTPPPTDSERFRPKPGSSEGPRGGKALGDITANPDPLDGGAAMGPALPGQPAGQAAVKFCQSLIYDNHPVDLTVVVGNVRVTARTGECSTLPNLACNTVPAGPQMVSLRHGDEVLEGGPMTIVADQQYFFYAEVVGDKVRLRGGVFPQGSTCAAATLEDVFRGKVGVTPPGPPPADAGTPASEDAGMATSPDAGGSADSTPAPPTDAPAPVDAGAPVDASGGGGMEAGAPPPGNTAAVRFCSLNPPGSNDPGVFTLSLAGQSYTVNKGQCAPAAGQPCAQVPAGTHAPMLALDGQPVPVASIRLAAGKEYVLVPGVEGMVAFLGVSPVERQGEGATCANRTWENVFAQGLPPYENPGGVYPAEMPPPNNPGGGGAAAPAF